MILSGPGFAILVVASLVATGLAVPAIPAAGYGNDTAWQATGPLPYFFRYNGSFPVTSPHDGYQDTAPITVYHFELDRGSLPGPRYMAFGPSVIALAVDPWLPVLLVEAGAIAAGAWYLVPRDDTDDDEDDDDQ